VLSLFQPISPGVLTLPELPNGFVASSSHSRSVGSPLNLTALKNSTANEFDLPKGRNLPALTKMAA
jgi:hypothetical protein